MKLPVSLLLAGGALLMPIQASSHFNMLEPANMIVQNERDDPQKKAPCGGTTADTGTLSGIVTPVRGGQMLHIKIKETVYHPGHYRLAFARTPAELPADPVAETRESEKGPQSVSAPIAKAGAPIIADGLFVHNQRPAPDFWETDIKIPNVDCGNCTLQVIQFMAEHSLNRDGDFSYHHCSALKITADPKLPLEKQWLGSSAK